MRLRSGRSPRALVFPGRALLSLACVAAQLAATAHLLTETHQICAEHGEAIHGASGRPHAVEASGRASLPYASLQASRPAGSYQEHTHCAVVSDRRDHAGVHVASGARPLPALPSTHPLRLRIADAPRAIALLALAPKSSPPV